MTTPAELVGGLGNLVTLPDVYVRCRALLDDPNSSMQDLGDVIRQDPALTARLLRIANSAFFGFATKIETVPRAITLMGTRQLHNLILATSVARAFSSIPDSVVNMAAFWWSSVYCGVASRLLAVRCHVLDTERLFVAGLLRDVGHLVMYQQIPDQARDAQIRAAELQQPLHVVEREMLGFDYADVGAALMREWGLPRGLEEVVSLHTQPGAAEAFALETAIVHLAAVCTARNETTHFAPQSAPLLDASVWTLTGLAEEVLEEIAEEADRFAFEAVDIIVPAQQRKF